MAVVETKSSFGDVQLLHCPDCFFMSMSLSKMCEHFFNHQESVEWQIFKCTECGIISSHEDLLDEHIMMNHPNCKREKAKSMLIDSVFTQELPQGYSIEGEFTPKYSYQDQYLCSFCKVIVTDPNAMKAHLEICHKITNVEDVSKFMIKHDNTVKKEARVKKIKQAPKEINYTAVPFKKVKVEDHMIHSPSPSLAVPSPLTNQPTSLIFSYNQLAEQTVSKVIQSSPADPTKVILCPEDSELKMELSKDALVNSYDPEPLRFLRHLIRAAIPIEELINFSWKGNRRGRPRHSIPGETGSSFSMLPPLHGSNTTPGVHAPRKSMKDDPRMRAFCWAVEKMTKKPLPENLGTHMHQFLSNLRNNSSK